MDVINEFKLNCKHCSRYVATVTSSAILEEVPCTGCGAKNNYKIIFSNDFTDAQLHHVFSKAETEPKKLKIKEQCNGEQFMNNLITKEEK